MLAVVQRQDGCGHGVVRRLRATGLAEVGDASVYRTLLEKTDAEVTATGLPPNAPVYLEAQRLRTPPLRRR